MGVHDQLPRANRPERGRPLTHPRRSRRTVRPGDRTPALSIATIATRADSPRPTTDRSPAPLNLPVSGRAG